MPETVNIPCPVCRRHIGARSGNVLMIGRIRIAVDRSAKVHCGDDSCTGAYVFRVNRSKMPKSIDSKAVFG